MADALDRDPEAGKPSSPKSDGSDEGRCEDEGLCEDEGRCEDEGLCEDEDELDIDSLVAVWKDDLLLDAIGGTPAESDQLDIPFDVSADRHLIEALLLWQREIERYPTAPRSCDPAEAAATFSVANGRRRRGFRVPIVSVLAAAVVLAFTAAAAYGAAPDEVLWPVTEILYSQHAASVRAAHDVGAAQAQASAAIAAGHREDADAALRAAAGVLPQVRRENGRDELQNRQGDLARELNAVPRPAVGKPPESQRQTPSRNSKTLAAADWTSPPSRPAPSSIRTAGDSPESRTRVGSSTSIRQSKPAPPQVSLTSTPPQSRERSTEQPTTQPTKSPRPTRSAVATATEAGLSAAPTKTRPPQPRAEPVRPIETQPSEPTVPTPTADQNTSQAAKPSSSVRKTGSRQSEVPSTRLTTPARTR
jgi:hypothetical protein